MRLNVLEPVLKLNRDAESKKLGLQIRRVYKSVIRIIVCAKQKRPRKAVLLCSAIQNSDILQFLPRTATFMRHVSYHTATGKFKKNSYKTLTKMAALPLAELEHFFGKNAAEVQESARGIDRSPVHSEREVKSISNEVTFGQDTSDMEQLLGTLRQLSDKVGYRMRQARLMGGVVQIKLRYGDFTTLTRQRALPTPTNLDDEIYAAVEKLFLDNLTPERNVRLVGVGVSQLSQPFQQLELWDDSRGQAEQLALAIDALKEKYGKNIITRGSQMKSRPQKKGKKD